MRVAMMLRARGDAPTGGAGACNLPRKPSGMRNVDHRHGKGNHATDCNSGGHVGYQHNAVRDAAYAWFRIRGTHAITGQ